MYLQLSAAAGTHIDVATFLSEIALAHVLVVAGAAVVADIFADTVVADIFAAGDVVAVPVFLLLLILLLLKLILLLLLLLLLLLKTTLFSQDPVSTEVFQVDLANPAAARKRCRAYPGKHT